MTNHYFRWLAVFTALLINTDARTETAANRPNLVFILSDDQSTPHLGCLGESGIRTPNLDRFATEGMLFDKQFCGAPQCVPSRATFLTGRSPVAVRITRFSSPLPADVPTMADILRDNGYYTGICRRNFHLDGPEGRGTVTDAVFKKHPDLRTFARRVDFLDVNSPREKTVPLVNQFLDQVPANKPFFLWVNFNEPHHVWNVPSPSGPHDPEKLTVPPYLPDIPAVRKDLARYYDEVAAMDEEFQWVMNILEKRHLSTNTLVMFLGDNGYAFPHGKGSLYDPGLNTPLLVRWPGKIKAGTKSSTLISGEDIAPTMLEAAGVSAPKQMTGTSFLKLLLGQPYEARKYIFAERGPHGQSTFNENTKASGFDQSRCVRSADFKLIYNCSPHMVYQPVDSSGDPYWKAITALHEQGKLAPEFDRAYFTNPRPIYELFDLKSDPGELHNLAGKAEYQKVEHELKAALQEKMIIDYDYLPLPLADKGGRKKGAAEEL